jgi:mannose-1-phosphate guanylyltransferase
MITVVPALMVGGAGTRLWPLSRQTRPKQFQALLGQQTLFQSTAARVAGTEGDVEFALPIVISGEAHAALVRSQLGADATPHRAP